MNPMATTDDLFFRKAGLDRARLEKLVTQSLTGTDDGELFLEFNQSESFVFDDGRLKSATFDITQGFGLRSVSDDLVGYAHASVLDEDAVRRAGDTVKAVRSGHGGVASLPPHGTNAQLYTGEDPITGAALEAKVGLLSDMDAYARAKDPRVSQVSASLTAVWQAVRIVRADGTHAADLRPLVRLNASVVVTHNGRKETGSFGTGGRYMVSRLLAPDVWRHTVDEALRQALVNLEAVPAPAGEMPVVLGPGRPGILLHEAIGHGLEGDFNRKKTSAFSDRIGQRIGSPGVTVVDDGTITDRRGSLTIDDEGTPSQRTVLIEDGILKGYMQDRQNARLMGMAPTGNGRRESFAHAPMPRMTNTYMLPGSQDRNEIIGSVDRGIYAVAFGGGQVDITSGKFVFTCTEAYEIEKGKIGRPLKGATLIGHGPDVLTRVSMIGNDLELDPGIGTCGKEGQGVPVGVGQPTIKVDRLTVGGTAV